MNRGLIIFFTVILLFIRKFILFILIIICLFYNYLLIANRIRPDNFSYEKNIDKFIEKYKDESFSEFENMHIFCRTRTISLLQTDVYILDDINHRGSWGVEYYCWTRTITSINYRPYKEAELDSIYLTNEEVGTMALKFIDCGFYSLTVENKNVYISLINNREFLRLNDTIIKDSMQIRGYIHYKDNWYINEDFNYE